MRVGREGWSGEVARPITPGKLGRRLAVGLLHVYQAALAPWLGPACRFEPSCSRYAVEAVSRHGVVRGAGMTFHRLRRCHPLGGSGYDPVP